MIFSRLFAPSHTSQNPKKRLEAIQNLSPEKPTEKTILHELAFNDEDADVSLAALNKLNSFVLWLKMSQIASNARVKKTAERTVEACLNGQGSVSITQSEKIAFLQESANAEVIQQVLVNDSGLLDDTELVLSLLSKVDKPAFTQRVFLDYASVSLQQSILPTIDDNSVLQKLEKKCRGKAIHPSIEARLNELKAEAEKPLELMRQLTLCLSKYQALLEKTDLDDIERRREVLLNEYNLLIAQSQVLDEDDKKQIEDKFSIINDKLTHYLARIRPQWEARKAAQQQADLEALCREQLVHARAQVDWLYNERLCEATLADVAVVNEAVRALEATIEQLEKHAGEIEFTRLARKQLSALTDNLDAFSQQQQYGQKFLTCLSQLETLAQEINQSTEEDNAVDENSIDSKFQALNKQYTLLRNELNSIPSALHKRWNEAARVFKNLKRTKKAQHDAALRQCRKLMGIIDSLIAQGRFRGAMAKFEKLKSSFTSLPDDIKAQIKGRFDKTADEIAHLEGWQDYIAAPRKPLLVEEAQTLANAPVEDIKQRSEAIRYLRQQWLSLSSSSDDAQLQSEFDDALERAFQPCREYYAQLDAQRAQALESRIALIERVRNVDLTQEPATLAKTFDRLSKQWHECGQVEKREYERVKAQWKDALKPLQNKVNEWYINNKKSKQALVSQAIELAGSDDINNAVEKAQQLQQQWKEVGHAGKRDESKLWRAFRQANDQLFSRLNELKKAQLSAQDAVFNELMDELKAIDSASSEAEILSVIQLIEEKAQDLPNALRGKLDRKIASIHKQFENRANERKQHKLEYRAKTLINVLQTGLQHGCVSDISKEQQAALGKRWVSAFDKSLDKTTQGRHWLTVALEVVVDVPSPASDSSMRTDVQLRMMTAKLERGDSVSAQQLLEDWIAHGSVSKDEEPLLARVIHIIETQPEIVG